MERTTRTIQTESGASIVVYDKMTGGDLMDLESAMMGNEIEANRETQTLKLNPSDIYKKNLRLLCDFLVVSVNGETDPEKKWSTLRSLEASEWNIVQDALKAISASSVSKKK